jgi:hypothetical protein
VQHEDRSLGGELLDCSPAPVVEGDMGAFITMGPGVCMELDLWSAGARAASRCVPTLQRVADPPIAAGIPGNGSVKFGACVACAA